VNFSEIVKAAGYDLAEATGECSLEALREAAKAMAESGEPVEVSERKFLAKKQAMIEDLKRAIERGKIVFPQDTRWLEHEQTH